MHRDTWKSGERRIAAMFNSFRTPLSGGNSRHTRSDSLHDTVFIECKHSKRPPGDTLWNEVKEQAKKEKKIPAIIFLKKHCSDVRIMCKLSDLKKIATEMKDENSNSV